MPIFYRKINKDNFYRVDAIPILGTGKIDLKKVKEMSQQLAALNNQTEP